MKVDCKDTVTTTKIHLMDSELVIVTYPGPLPRVPGGTVGVGAGQLRLWPRPGALGLVDLSREVGEGDTISYGAKIFQPKVVLWLKYLSRFSV